MTDHVEAIVVGAGVVGLAVARSLARSGIETLVLERESDWGTQTSSRNSEVVHAGIYYPAGSLKAKLCVAGREALYAFCQRAHVEHWVTGKLIVATTAEQEGKLATIAAHAAENGVDDMRILSARQARDMEPELRCSAALLSPSTGIIDSRGFMRTLLADAEQHGAMLGLRSPVLSLERSGGRFLLRIGGDEPTLLSCRLLVIAAGHGASELTRTLADVPGACVPDTHWAKGNYFSLSGKSPFGRLVYPVPEPGGLGVHLTLDLGGQARFGPDVEWTENFDYAVNPQRGDCFYEAIRRYWPGLPSGSLAPAYAGIRPKISRPGEKDADFLVLGPLQHGVAGMVSLFGIESPGLTASLAIAEHVCALLKD